MFGNKTKLTKELQDGGGTVAWATVLDSTVQWRSSSSSALQANASMTDHAKVRLSVQPDGEQPFEVTFHQGFPGAVPLAGWQCKVIFDPNDHSKIAVLEDQVFPPGIDHEAAERTAATRRDMRNAMRSGNMAEYIQQVKAQAASGAFPGVVMVDGQIVSGSAAPQPAAPQTTVADQLTKLADLRDRGALTDAEFATEKAKLLASE